MKLKKRSFKERLEFLKSNEKEWTKEMKAFFEDMLIRDYVLHLIENEVPE